MNNKKLLKLMAICLTIIAIIGFFILNDIPGENIVESNNWETDNWENEYGKEIELAMYDVKIFGINKYNIDLTNDNIDNEVEVILDKKDSKIIINGKDFNYKIHDIDEVIEMCFADINLDGIKELILRTEYIKSSGFYNTYKNYYIYKLDINQGYITTIGEFSFDKIYYNIDDNLMTYIEFFTENDFHRVFITRINFETGRIVYNESREVYTEPPGKKWEPIITIFGYETMTEYNTIENHTLLYIDIDSNGTVDKLEYVDGNLYLNENLLIKNVTWERWTTVADINGDGIYEIFNEIVPDSPPIAGTPSEYEIYKYNPQTNTAEKLDFTLKSVPGSAKYYNRITNQFINKYYFVFGPNDKELKVEKINMNKYKYNNTN